MDKTSELMLPGYSIDTNTGAWVTLPWPGDKTKPMTDPERLALLPPSLAPFIIAWAEHWLKHPQTDRPWRYTIGQKRFLHMWYALDPETGRWLYRSGVKRAAKGPIAHDTPVMTPTGWTRHGDLRVGDKVYAQDGTITTVTAIKEEVLEQCYRIHFRTGDPIIATQGHRWPMEVFNGSGRDLAKVTTAGMLAAGLKYHRPSSASSKATSGDVARFCALPTPAIQGTAMPPVIDAWLLGYWLGNGDADGSRVTCNATDLDEITGYIQEAGETIGTITNTHGNAWRISTIGTRDRLRRAGVWKNKHIPDNVLRAPAPYRWAVLQGIVDADGHINQSGVVEVCLSNERLAQGVYELATTLGLMPTTTTRQTACFGKEHGTARRVRFTPLPGQRAAQLRRKAERIREAGERRHARPFSRSRTVVDIEPVPTVPARCITVAHHSHAYLVGRDNIPTCNSGKDPFGATIALAEFCGPVEFAGLSDEGYPVGRVRKLSKVQLAANSLSQATELLTMANAMVTDKLVAAARIDRGLTRTMLPSGSRLELLTASEKSMEGAPATAVILNESHHMTQSSGGVKVSEVARRNVGKSPRHIQARMLELTNAHQTGMDSVAERSFHAWQDQVAAGNVDILYDSVEADPRLDITDEDQLRTAIKQAYTDAPWIDTERIIAEAQDQRTSTADTIRFYLNGLAAAEDAWVDPANFDALARPEEVVEQGERVAMFLDCSKSSDATTLSACRLSDGHVMSLGGWRKPHGHRGNDWLAPREVVDAVVREAFAFYKVCWFGVDPSPATDDETEALYWRPMIDRWHQDFATKLPVWATPGAGGHSVLFDMRLSQPGAVKRNRMFTEAAMQTAIDIDEEATLTHDGDPMLRNHVHNAKRRPNQWGIGLGKVNRSSNNLVDYAVTMVGARMGRTLALNSPKVAKIGKRKGARIING